MFYTTLLILLSFLYYLLSLVKPQSLIFFLWYFLIWYYKNRSSPIHTNNSSLGLTRLNIFALLSKKPYLIFLLKLKGTYKRVLT